MRMDGQEESSNVEDRRGMKNAGIFRGGCTLLIDVQTFKPEALVFWTEHNPGQAPDYGEYVAGLIPGASFYNMLDAAHWPQWEKPEEHDQVLIEFIKG